MLPSLSGAFVAIEIFSDDYLQFFGIEDFRLAEFIRGRQPLPHSEAGKCCRETFGIFNQWK